MKIFINKHDQSNPVLSGISEKDRKIIDELNKTETPIPDYLVQNFFEKQVKLTPEKTAVISNSQSLTYQELDEKANKLSRHLIHLGVVHGDTVGLCTERSIEMVISILGILKSGCCYLPLDPSLPIERLSYIFEDSRAKILISQESLIDSFRYFSNALFVIIDDGKILKSTYPADRLDIKLDSQALAYIIYTSGSTGKPKGIKVHHQAVVNLINSMSVTPGIKENDVLLAVVTMSFDMSVFEIFLPLSNGATIVIASGEERLDGRALIRLIDKYNVTILQATPSLWYNLLTSGWIGKNNLKALCGGEALTSSIVLQILPKVGELWNCYGPTETTVYSTLIRIIDAGSKILIGKPIDNTKIYILDENNELLPPGVIGEVCIGGLGVSKGYINKPDLTSQKFIRFDNNQIIYKTGDRGKYHKDGNVELFGRIDNQVKIRGYRIEPEEIEILLSQLEGINEAVVKSQEFDLNDIRLVAYLNVSENFRIDTKELNRQIKEKLPSYMIPYAYKTMNRFPRTPNGKIDRKALSLEINESGISGINEAATFTPTEKIIYNIWCKILKTEEISITDNFFEIGGNSLLALSVFSNILSTFNIDLNLRVFFDSPRIRDLGETIDIASRNPTGINQGEKKDKTHFNFIDGEI